MILQKYTRLLVDHHKQLQKIWNVSDRITHICMDYNYVQS